MIFSPRLKAIVIVGFCWRDAQVVDANVVVREILQCAALLTVSQG